MCNPELWNSFVTEPFRRVGTLEQSDKLILWITKNQELAELNTEYVE
jgi:hypothetical protein